MKSVRERMEERKERLLELEARKEARINRTYHRANANEPKVKKRGGNFETAEQRARREYDEWLEKKENLELFKKRQEEEAGYSREILYNQAKTVIQSPRKIRANDKSLYKGLSKENSIRLFCKLSGYRAEEKTIKMLAEMLHYQYDNEVKENLEFNGFELLRDAERRVRGVYNPIKKHMDFLQYNLYCSDMEYLRVLEKKTKSISESERRDLFLGWKIQDKKRYSIYLNNVIKYYSEMDLKEFGDFLRSEQSIAEKKSAGSTRKTREKTEVISEDLMQGFLNVLSELG